MRFLLVALIWVVIVGGLWSYISHRDNKREQVTAVVLEDTTVKGQFAIEVTPTFSIEADPFALTTTDANPSSLEVRLNGIQISADSEELQRGRAIRLDGVTGVLAGHNEIFVSASPPLSENMIEHGIRVKLFEENTLLIDQTVWADQGALVSGTVSFNHQQEEGSHDH